MQTSPWETIRRKAEAGDAPAAYQYGHELCIEGRYEESRRWLQRAAEGGMPDARAWLGLHHLYGYGLNPDPQRALAQLTHAERDGSALASYQLACWECSQQETHKDSAAMAQRLLRAARADHVESLRALAMLYARQLPMDAHNPGHACLARAAALGDAFSLFLLGRRLLLQGDAQRGGALLAAARQAGVARADAYLHIAAAPARVNAPAPQGLPPPDPLGTSASDAQVVRLSESPLLETRDAFFDAEECEYLIVSAQPHMQPSVTVEADGIHRRNPDRRSSDTQLIGLREDFCCRWLQWRMTRWLGVPLAHAEYLTVLRYRAHDEYRPHYDYLEPGTFGNTERAEDPGQRVHTVFAYLTDVQRGGETLFPRLQRQVEPRQGRIVHFRNLDAHGQADAKTLHAGAQVQAGEKWLATLWTRQRPFRTC